MSTIAPPAPPGRGARRGEEGRQEKKLIIILVVLLLVAGGAGYWFFLKPPAEPPEPVPGEVVALDPIQVNLADGHYLRIGIALQLTTEAHEADGSKALDAVIDLFSGVDMDELTKPRNTARS